MLAGLTREVHWRDIQDETPQKNGLFPRGVFQSR